jgi:alpha-glucosidase
MKNLILFIFLFSTLQVFADLVPASNFYKKFKVAEGLIIKGSGSIEDASLITAASTINKMLSKRPDIRMRMISNGASVAVIAKNESYCDIPEATNLRKKQTFDGRNFCEICGGGGVVGRPITTVCEDNLLKTKKDPYFGQEDILTHEFAHAIHLLGMNQLDKDKITIFYSEAKAKGIFEKNSLHQSTYMMVNEQEFFACLSAAWFGVHNRNSPNVSQELVNRDSIKEKLPDMYEFMKTIYPE